MGLPHSKICCRNVVCVFWGPQGTRRAVFWHPEILPISLHNDEQSKRFVVSQIPRTPNELCVNCGLRLLQRTRGCYCGTMTTYSCPQGCDHVSENQWEELLARTPSLPGHGGLNVDALTCWEQVYTWNIGSVAEFARGVGGRVANIEGDAKVVDDQQTCRRNRTESVNADSQRTSRAPHRHRTAGPYAR